MNDSDATAVFLGQCFSGVAIDCIDFGKIWKLPLALCSNAKLAELRDFDCCSCKVFELALWQAY
jgi:hypothetical protein